ncbi:hypothetical protein KIPB_011754, partial [Kipferlia bialata]
DGQEMVEGFRVGYSAGLAGTPFSVYDGTHKIKYPLAFSPFNTTAWSVSSEYGPVDTSGPAARQLEMMLSALAIVPYMDTWVERHAPFLSVHVDFADWDATYPVLQAPESISFCTPLLEV